MNNNYDELLSVAQMVAPRSFHVSKSDTKHDDRSWHFQFANQRLANEFWYRIHILGFETTTNTHNDVWVGLLV